MAIYEVKLTFRIKDRPNRLKHVLNEAVNRTAAGMGFRATGWNAKWVDHREHHEKQQVRKANALRRLRDQTDDASGIPRKP